MDRSYSMSIVGGVMESVRGVTRDWALILLLFSTQLVLSGAWAQEKQTTDSETDSLIIVAREIMAAARYCALITVDSTGQPQVRAMDPFPPEEDMTVWLGTNSMSRKVKEIRNESRVTLYYADSEGGGYVSIAGTARLVDDEKEKARRWKEGWETFFRDQKERYLLIAVTPVKLEILSYKHGITGDATTWRTPSVIFEPGNQEE
jgi:general stress protein 26